MTLKEFAESYLSPPIRERFLYNVRANIERYRESFQSDEDVEHDIILKLSCPVHEKEPQSGIMSGFWWGGTPEGSGYWSLLYYEIGEKYDIRRSR